MFNDRWGSLEELSQPEDNIYFVFTLLYKLVLFYFYSDYHCLESPGNVSYLVTGLWLETPHVCCTTVKNASGLFQTCDSDEPYNDVIGSRLSKN